MIDPSQHFQFSSLLGNLGSLLTFGLMGASVALFSSEENRRALFGPAIASRRSDDDANLYARRVQDFEDSVQKGIAQSTRR